MQLFKLDIDKSSWEHIYQSIDAFEMVVKAIFEKHGLAIDKIENLTPGTNAVFKVGDKVVKIFAPVESGFYDVDYFDIEIEAQKHVNSVNVASPKLLFRGVIEDKYTFRYIIMEFIKGQEAGEKLATFTDEQRHEFAVQIRNMTRKLNVRIQNKAIPVITQKLPSISHSWDDYPMSFRDDKAAVIRDISLDNLVYVHGDLTAENMIIDDNGTACLIDFADSLIAPYYYEWMPLVFSLFKCDPIMMAAYFGDYHNDDFYDRLTRGVLFHEFGGPAVKELCKAKGVGINTLTDVSHLKTLLVQYLRDGKSDLK